MPDRKTIARAKKDKREGKSASTQAGEFVREEIEHVRKGKHGARSARQAMSTRLDAIVIVACDSWFRRTSGSARFDVDIPPHDLHLAIRVRNELEPELRVQTVRVSRREREASQPLQ